MKLPPDKNGYSQAMLWYNKKHNTLKVHRLVLENFKIGKRTKKRMETEIIINNPPPTGVPVLIL